MYLTKRQREIYEFIRGHIPKKGYAPSILEIGKRFRLSSPATVHKHLCSPSAWRPTWPPLASLRCLGFRRW